MFDTPEIAVAIVKQVQPQTPTKLAAELIQSLAASRQEAVGVALLGRWGMLVPSARREAVGILLLRPYWTDALLTGIEKDVVTKADLSKPQVEQLTANPDPALAARAREVLAKVGGLPNPDREKLIQQAMPLTAQRGDAAAGARPCAELRRLPHPRRLGRKVGPVLDGVFKGNKQEILTKILDPNRSVQGGYRLWVVQTRSGDTLSGRLLAENNNGFEVLDTSGQSHTVLRRTSPGWSCRTAASCPRASSPSETRR